MSNFLSDLPHPFFVLAPMDDVTETVFRRVVGECAAPDVYMTEFVNVDALCSPGRDAALRRLKFTDTERPLIAQIWGRNPSNFERVADELVGMGFDGVDINFGCPDKAVVKNGCCGGMIERPDQAVEIIKATKRGIDGRLPLSIKTRIGFREFDESWLRTLLEQKLNMLSIHLRTVREMSKVPAHWELADRVREIRDSVAPDTLLVGNGDVMNRSQAAELARRHSYDGIMIGRGIFQDPYAFSKDSPWINLAPLEKVRIFQRHVELFAETWEEGERPIAPLNKFCKIYVNDFPNAKDMRVKLMNCNSTEELRSTITAIVTELENAS